MCYAPRKIPNNSRRYNLNHDKLYLNVPCGKCGECKQKKQDDTTARLYYQFIDTCNTFVPGFHYSSSDGSVVIHERGYAYFESFTYNEDCCPWLHGIRVFRPSDYRSFSVNLRHELDRRGYLVEVDGKKYMPIKLYWTSEFGGETYRPHHHAIFFVTAPIPPEELEEILQKCWSIAVKKPRSERSVHDIYNYVSLGWTDISNPNDHTHDYPHQLVCDSMSVLSYVANYVGKDYDFEFVCRHQKNSNYDDQGFTDEEYYAVRPYTRQSNGIGLCIKDIVTIEDLMDGRMTIPDTLNGTKSIALPLYIDRKVFYDYNPDDKCFRLNEKGYKMKEHRLEHNRDYIRKQVDWLWSNVAQLWTDRSADFIGSLTRYHKVYGSPADCMQKISNVLYDRKDDFIDYILYYKDIYSTYKVEVDDGANLRDLALTAIVKHVEPDPIYSYNLQDIRDSDPLDYKIITTHTYGCSCERFKDFDQVIAILNGINLAFCCGRQQEYLRKQAEKSRQKRLYKQGFYKAPTKTYHSLNRF